MDLVTLSSQVPMPLPNQPCVKQDSRVTMQLVKTFLAANLWHWSLVKKMPDSPILSIGFFKPSFPQRNKIQHKLPPLPRLKLLCLEQSSRPCSSMLLLLAETTTKCTSATWQLLFHEEA